MIDKLRQMAQTAKQDGAMVLVSPETIEQLLDVAHKATALATELVEELTEHDCTNWDGGNTSTCERCSCMRTIDSLHHTLEGESK